MFNAAKIRPFEIGHDNKSFLEFAAYTKPLNIFAQIQSLAAGLDPDPASYNLGQ